MYNKIKFFDVKRRINFHSARQIFDGAAVATARKSNAADGNIDKFNAKLLSIRCTSTVPKEETCTRLITCVGAIGSFISAVQGKV